MRRENTDNKMILRIVFDYMRNLHTFRCYKNILKFVNFSRQITEQHVTTKTNKHQHFNANKHKNKQNQHQLCDLMNSKKHENVRQRVDKFINQNSNHNNQIDFDCVMLIVVASNWSAAYHVLRDFVARKQTQRQTRQQADLSAAQARRNRKQTQASRRRGGSGESQREADQNQNQSQQTEQRRSWLVFEQAQKRTETRKQRAGSRSLWQVLM